MKKQYRIFVVCELPKSSLSTQPHIIGWNGLYPSYFRTKVDAQEFYNLVNGARDSQFWIVELKGNIPLSKNRSKSR